MPGRPITIQLPNPTDRDVRVEVRLETVPEDQLSSLGIDLPSERLRLRTARMTTLSRSSTFVGCLSAIQMTLVAFVRWLIGRPGEVRVRPLHVRIGPQSTTAVRVSIATIGAKGVAAMRLVDVRDGRVVGGVTIVVLEGVVEPVGHPIPAENPCPILLTEEPFWLPAPAEPNARRLGGPLPAGSDVKLVAWLTNPTKEPLEDATAYLEHLGGADAEFRPATWNLGSFEPGATFPATWLVRAQPSTSGSWTSSIVVESKGFEPIRLRHPIAFGRFMPDETLAGGDAEAIS